MNLSRYLQDEKLILSARGKGYAFLRERILEKGNRWYRDNPGECDGIAANCRAFGFSCDEPAVQAVKQHLLLHYYEKILPLCCSPLEFHAYLNERIDAREALHTVGTALNGGNAVLIALSHFGAIELITPTLAAHGFAVTAAVRFQAAHFSGKALEHARILEREGNFGTIRFIEIGRPDVPAALEMAAVIRRREILLSVFDEKTDYSVPAALFGRKVWGGAGLDRLVKFSNTPVAVFTAFMVRTGGDRYFLRLRDAASAGKSLVDGMYECLQDTVRANPEQWYFLHEEIPFIE